MQAVTHVTIHHDPEGRCEEQLKKHQNDLRNLFIDGFVVVTPETYNRTTTRELLKNSGFFIISRSSMLRNQIDTAFNVVLLAGEQKGQGELLFSGCLDRTLHWMDAYPHELERIISEGAQKSDFLIIGRTNRALKTHPQLQLDPEIYTNKVVGKVICMPFVDVSSGCSRILTKKAAKTILAVVKRTKRLLDIPGVDFIDSIWPYIVYLNKLCIGYIEVEGLEFETPDQYRKEIDRIGYDEWVKRNFTRENISIRWKRAKETEIWLKEFLQSYK